MKLAPPDFNCNNSQSEIIIKKSAKYSLYGLKCLIFITLLIGCYFQYIRSALEDYLKGSISVVTRSEEITKFEAPAITICADNDFKPSIQSLYQFPFPTRFLFTGKLDRKLQLTDPETLARVYELFENTTVEKIYKNFSIANDLTFILDNVYLKEVN